MILLEIEAINRWCPLTFSRPVTVDKPDGDFCVGSRCMFWREAVMRLDSETSRRNRLHGVDVVVKAKGGYCGAAPLPAQSDAI